MSINQLKDGIQALEAYKYKTSEKLALDMVKTYIT